MNKGPRRGMKYKIAQIDPQGSVIAETFRGEDFQVTLHKIEDSFKFDLIYRIFLYSAKGGVKRLQWGPAGSLLVLICDY